jgi:outer membrane biosynthesis protein TonB
MSRVDAAAASDRLPWLSDEPQPTAAKRSGSGALLGWAAAALALVAGAGFWLGTRSVEQQPAASARQSGPAMTVPLPEPRSAQPEVRLPDQPEVRTPPAPEVRPWPAPQVRLAPPPPKVAEREVQTDASAEQAAQQTGAKGEQPSAAKPVAAAPRTQTVPLRPWQPRVVTGAAGRLVEIGAFGSVPQAKLGWRYMVRAYPAMTRLPAVVRPDRNSKGRTFYRFRVGTTSQAHSEVLCQRMQRIGLSCAVVGLPWKAKVER